MKLSIMSAVAAAFVAITASSASAVTVAKPSQNGAERITVTEQVANRRGHYGQNRNWRHNDRRYDRYRGWNRYNSRPGNWRSRGCVAVGPIWFCK